MWQYIRDPLTLCVLRIPQHDMDDACYEYTYKLFYITYQHNGGGDHAEDCSFFDTPFVLAGAGPAGGSHRGRRMEAQRNTSERSRPRAGALRQSGDGAQGP